MQVRYNKASGEYVVYDLPTEDTPIAAELIDDAAAALASEYRNPLRSKPERRSWLRPLAYRLISACLDADLQHYLYRRSLKAGRYGRGDISSSNPFKLGMMAIFAEDELFEKEYRYELGNILWLAYRHYVPDCFVNGVYHQMGKQRSDEYIDPDFSEWIVERRVMDIRTVDPRGSYPNDIESRVQKLRSENTHVIGSFLEAMSGHSDTRN
jgi:hypothetical protein